MILVTYIGKNSNPIKYGGTELAKLTVLKLFAFLNAVSDIATTFALILIVLILDAFSNALLAITFIVEGSVYELPVKFLPGGNLISVSSS